MIWLSGCAVGTGRIELRAQHDDMLLSVYTVEIGSSTSPAPTPTHTPSPTPTPTSTQIPTSTSTPSASLSPDPSTVNFRAIGTEWHQFTASSSEPIVVVANPGSATATVEIIDIDITFSLCKAENNNSYSPNAMQVIWLAGCEAGTGTVELRAASDDTVLRTYTFDVAPKPTPPLNFSVSAKVFGGTQDGEDLHNAKWLNIADPHFQLKLEGAPSGVDLADYEYRVRAPSSTGIHALSSKADCSPTQPSTRSAWFSAEAPSEDSYAGVHLVRCGFGDGTTELLISLRYKAMGQDPAQEFTGSSYSRVMKAPWHTSNQYVSYQIGCFTATTTPDLNYVDGIEAGADAWDDAEATVRINRNSTLCGNVEATKVGRVTVKQGTWITCDHLYAIACMINDDLTAYPHLTTRRIIVATGFGRPWSSDANGDGRILDHEIYLPGVMMHEFGHTAGLPHSSHGSGVMSHSFGRGTASIVDTPSSNDISAMRDYNRSHTH